MSPHQLNRLVTPALSLHRRWGRRLWKGHNVSIRGLYHMGGPCFQSVWLVLRIAAGRLSRLCTAQRRSAEGALAAGIESALGHYLCAPGAVFTPTGTYCHSQKRIGWWWQWLGTLRLVSEQGLSLRHPHFVNPSRKEHLHLTPCLLASHLPPPPVPLNFKHHRIP